ncbi:MAG: SHOCT domain-containing protein [Halosimplex sp.]
MRLSDWARDHLLATVALALAFGTLTAVSVLGVAAWTLWALLSAPGAATLGSLLPLFLVGLVVGVPVTAVSTLAAAVGLASRASAAASARAAVAGTRLGQAVSYVEHESVTARLVGLSALVETVDTRSADERVDDRIERLKDRYVEGELSEYEFERRTQRILDEEGVHRDRSSSLDDQFRAIERN